MKTAQVCMNWNVKFSLLSYKSIRRSGDKTGDTGDLGWTIYHTSSKVNPTWDGDVTWPHEFGLASLWRHYDHDGVSNHQPHDCLLNCLFRRWSKKIPKLRVTGLCAGNLPVTGEFPAQRVSNAENVSSWWRHYSGWVIPSFLTCIVTFISTISDDQKHYKDT